MPSAPAVTTVRGSQSRSRQKSQSARTGIETVEGDRVDSIDAQLTDRTVLLHLSLLGVLLELSLALEFDSMTFEAKVAGRLLAVRASVESSKEGSWEEASALGFRLIMVAVRLVNSADESTEGRTHTMPTLPSIDPIA